MATTRHRRLVTRGPMRVVRICKILHLILWRRLREPDVPCIPCELSALQSPHDRVSLADFASDRVDEIRAALHLSDELVVKQVLGLGKPTSFLVNSNLLADTPKNHR